jgi:hypothetical protein
LNLANTNIQARYQSPKISRFLFFINLFIKK